MHIQPKLEMIPELIHINALSRHNVSLCRAATILFKDGWLFLSLRICTPSGSVKHRRVFSRWGGIKNGFGEPCPDILEANILRMRLRRLNVSVPFCYTSKHEVL